MIGKACFAGLFSCFRPLFGSLKNRRNPPFSDALFLNGIHEGYTGNAPVDIRLKIPRKETSMPVRVRQRAPFGGFRTFQRISLKTIGMDDNPVD